VEEATELLTFDGARALLVKAARAWKDAPSFRRARDPD
jgi:hypothetical protein